MAAVGIARVYGRRPVPGAAVLVDRVWPRGVRKDQVEAPWFREIGPSNELRRWFAHRPERWPEFRERYRRELERPPQRELLDQLVEMARRGPLTLLYSARDEERNQAAVLKELIEQRL